MSKITYDFDQLVDRRGTHSLKYDQLPAGAAEGSLPLWVADMDFPCAQPILDALHQRVDRKIFGYTLYDSPEAKQAITGWFSRRFGWEIAPGDILSSPGCVPAISLLLQFLTQPGDSVLIQNPVYYPFASKILANGRGIVSNSLVYQDGEYAMDLDDLEAKLSLPEVKGMILCSPHNPVGRVWSERELKGVVEAAKKHDKWIISDEIHCDLVRKGVTHHPLLKLCPEYSHRIVALTAPSKTFNLAGLQLSNVVIPSPEYQAQWKELTSRLSVGGCGPMGLTAMIAAYTQGEDWLEQVRAYLDENMDYCARFVRERLPKARMVYPQGTYLIWLDLRGYCKDGKELERIMLQQAKVAFDEGYIFGPEGEGFERVNAACPRFVLQDCLERMEAVLEPR